MVKNRRKTALVTGADGFIGSHLTQLLLSEGYAVTALSQYNSFNDWGWLECVPQNNQLRIVTGDVRDPGFCRELTHDQDLIFHLAALIAIPYSYTAPDSYVATNINGTLNICQGARDNGALRVLVTSTSEVYGTARYVPIDERHPKQPQSPYSATKIAADALALSFHNAFNLPVTIVRPFNTYGPRQSARAIIPTIISQIASGAQTIKVGDLTPTRDFNFVEDTCRGFLAIAQAEASKVVGQEINIASGTDISMREVLDKIAFFMGWQGKWEVDPARLRPSTSEVRRLLGDSTKLRELTGWSPQVNIDEGLHRTIEWFINPDNLKRYKTTIYNR